MRASAKTQVVYAGAFMFRRAKFFGGYETVFAIAGKDIEAARQTQQVGGPSFSIGGNDQFIEVDMRRGERMLTIRFKAVGLRQQKDAFELYGAINSLL